jgi:hypothetical protein
VILLCSGIAAAISEGEVGRGEAGEDEFGGGEVSDGDAGGGKLAFVRVSPVTPFSPTLAMRANATNAISK